MEFIAVLAVQSVDVHVTVTFAIAGCCDHNIFLPFLSLTVSYLGFIDIVIVFKRCNKEQHGGRV